MQMCFELAERSFCDAGVVTELSMLIPLEAFRDVGWHRTCGIGDLFAEPVVERDRFCVEQRQHLVSQFDGKLISDDLFDRLPSSHAGFASMIRSDRIQA
jgi:hypothetical protein